jgi:hypothetical protein
VAIGEGDPEGRSAAVAPHRQPYRETIQRPDSEAMPDREDMQQLDGEDAGAG